MSKIRNVEKNYNNDLLTLAHLYLDIVLCPGGRPRMKGYVCSHCGVDTTYGDCKGVIGFKTRKKQAPPLTPSHHPLP
jgi:hypothetical protein